MTSPKSKMKTNDLNHSSTINLQLSSTLTSYCTPNHNIDDSSIWKPPLPLQQKQINPINQYSLFFPLELSHKDYLHKIFDLILIGTQSKVLSILKDNHIVTNLDNYFDVYYILQLLIHHKDLFTSTLSIVSIDNYQQSVIFLLKMQEYQRYMKDEFDYHDIIKSNFDHSIFLLDAFGKYSKVVYDLLIVLANQYKSHQIFKQQRIQELGWNIKDINMINNETISLLDIFDHSNIDDLINIIKDNLTFEHAANIRLICRLTNYSIDMNIYLQQILKLHDFNEVKRIKLLDGDIQIMLDCITCHPIYGNGRSRLIYLNNLCNQAKIYIEQYQHIIKYSQKCIEIKDLINNLDLLMHSFPSGMLLDNIKSMKNKSKFDHNYLLLDTFKIESMFYLLRISNNQEIMQYICHTWYNNVVATAKENNEEVKNLDLFNVMFLKRLGFSSIDMHNAKYTALELKNGGYSSCNEMKSAGYSANELKDAGYTVLDLKNAGYTTYDLKYAGFSHTDVQSYRKVIHELRISGHNVSSLRSLGYNAIQLKSAGYTATLLKGGDFTIQELKEAGFNFTALKSAGYTVDEIKNS